MSMNRNGWLSVIKMLYKPLIRPAIKKFVFSTSNNYDDELLKATDLFFG